MTDEIMPMQSVPEIVHIVRAATYEIERVCDGHGIALRRIKSVCQLSGQPPHGVSLCEEIMDTLFRVFTQYDKLRTEQVEALKKHNVELLNLIPVRVVLEPPVVEDPDL